MSATEELVAYLDGELSVEACRRVEKRLGVDAEYRRQMSDLDRAWTALEELPAATVDDNFTRTTIDMVAVAAERERTARTSAIAVQRRKRRWFAAAGCALLAVAAFVVARGMSTRVDRALLTDLPVVAQLEELRQIRDIEFLRGLSQIGAERFTNLNDAIPPASMAVEAIWSTPIERVAWIEQLSDREKSDLAARLKRFHDETPKAQDQLRQLETEIDGARDRDALRETWTAYTAWVNQQTPGERAKLREMSTDERLAAVRNLLDEERRTVHRKLSPADEQALQDAILELVEERRAELEGELQRRGNTQRLAGRSTADVAMVILLRELRDEDRRAELQDRLTADLSALAQEHLQLLRRWERARQMHLWIREALQPKYGPQELQTYFASNKLSNDEREELLSLPRAEMEERLERMYVNSQLGLTDGDWANGWGRPGRSGRDGPARGPRDREFGPGGRDGRDGPPRDFEGRPFDRGPGRPPGPPGPGGPPPDGRPRDWRNWPPPSDGPPPGGGPLPVEPGPPPEEQPI
jgi:hypothetical protein